jgi:hypothetical protein
MAKAPNRCIKDSVDIEVELLDRLDSVKTALGCSKKDALNTALRMGLFLMDNPNMMVALFSNGARLTTGK